jgi:hypothetical protein
MSYKIIDKGIIEVNRVDGGEINSRYVIIDLGDGINKKFKMNRFININGEYIREYIEDENGKEVSSSNLFEYLMENVGLE